MKFKTGICPVCGSINIEGEGVAVIDTGATQEVSCNDCEARWIDWHRLDHQILLEKNGRTIQEFIYPPKKEEDLAPEPTKEAAPRITMICPDCGSDNVLKDAYAAWNIDTQEWELHSVYDSCTCSDCGAEDMTPNEEEVKDDGK